MKRMLLLFTILGVVALGLAGCQKTNPAPGTVQGEGSIGAPAAGQEQEEIPPSAGGDVPTGEDIAPEEDRLVIMDAPLYRGTVTEISEENGVWELRLEQAEGTTFGYPAVTMVTDDSTRTSFELSGLEVGDYLEVYYGDRADGEPPVIIAANRLLPAKDCIFNGELTLWEHEGNAGIMELTPLFGGEPILFHYDDSTNFYLNTAEMKEGDQLNIFHRGTLTRSIPPQGFALEVRPYAE